MTRLVCSDPQCESHDKLTDPLFTINVTVGSDRELAENLNKVEAKYFTCAYCHAEAEVSR
jgi:hypothetical protein